MKVAKIVFWIAGIRGILVISPLYFMFEVIGRQDPPAITHPGFYYGFISVGLAGQICLPGHRAGSGSFPIDDDSFHD